MTPKIFERIYIELKREVTSGRYMPGQRLQARSLADTLRTSTSPVNQAMRQLIGEQVLEYSHHDGFIVPRVTERRLRDLIQWSAWLTRLSATSHVPETTAPKADISDIVAGTESLLRCVVASGQSGEFLRAIDNANYRLRATRRLEEHLFNDRPAELQDLIQTWDERDLSRLSHALKRYHDRRLAAVSQLVGLSYQERL